MSADTGPCVCVATLNEGSEFYNMESCNSESNQRELLCFH